MHCEIRRVGCCHLQCDVARGEASSVRTQSSGLGGWVGTLRMMVDDTDQSSEWNLAGYAPDRGRELVPMFRIVLFTVFPESV